jgi:hypothetical protein
MRFNNNPAPNSVPSTQDLRPGYTIPPLAGLQNALACNEELINEVVSHDTNENYKS